MLLIISIVAVLAFLILPLLLHRRQGAPRTGIVALLYFIAVGFGYILVEISLIQRFVLFLGHPTYALTVVVFLMLLSSGIGSLASRRWCADVHRLWLPLCAIIFALVIYTGVLPLLLGRLVGAPFFAKLIISGIVLVPLGFAMGMPFPTGLRGLASARPDDNSIEWAWAMNAGSSVLGSVLAIVVAIQFGLNATLACGAAAYVLALL